MVTILHDDYDVKHVHSVSEMAGGWNREATKALLGIWGDSSVQSQLDGVVRNNLPQDCQEAERNGI